MTTPTTADLPQRLSTFALAARSWIALTLASAAAGTMSSNATAPAGNGFDIANLGDRNGTDMLWAEDGHTAPGAAKGQTFRTA